MRKKFWKPFTLMVVPHSGEQVRSMSISKTLVVSAAVFLLLAGASGGYFIYKFSEYRDAKDQFTDYKSETEQIRNEYDALAGTAESVKQKLETLKKLENDLRARNGLPPAQDTKSDSNRQNQGGVLQSRSGMSNQFMVLNRDAVLQLEKDADKRMQSAESAITSINQKEAAKQEEEKRKQYQAAHLPSIWPTGYRNVTSDFGYRRDPFGGFYSLHTGYDIAGDAGSPIVATADGVVEQAGWNGGYGISVLINHGNGLSTRYGHMSAIQVEVGQTVTKGETIGRMGSTGRSTGTHVHYEVLQNGTVINPANYLP